MAYLLAELSGLIQWGMETFHTLVAWLASFVEALGYLGVVALMFLESSFFPFPSEVVLPPAGYLASKGQMNLAAVILCGVAGSISGALFNYYIAIRWGRRFFERFGKYFFVSPEALDKSEAFFEKHGHISTFTARLLPVVRQYVSLPAGLSRMNLTKFCLYTGLGSAIWVTTLSLVGYCIGSEGEEMSSALHKLTICFVLLCAALVIGYVVYNVRSKKSGRCGDK